MVKKEHLYASSIMIYNFFHFRTVPMDFCPNYLIDPSHPSLWSNWRPSSGSAWRWGGSFHTFQTKLILIYLYFLAKAIKFFFSASIYICILGMAIKYIWLLSSRLQLAECNWVSANGPRRLWGETLGWAGRWRWWEFIVKTILDCAQNHHVISQVEGGLQVDLCID